VPVFDTIWNFGRSMLPSIMFVDAGQQ